MLFASILGVQRDTLLLFLVIRYKCPNKVVLLYHLDILHFSKIALEYMLLCLGFVDLPVCSTVIGR